MDVFGLTDLKRRGLSAWGLFDLLQPETAIWAVNAKPDGPYKLSEIMAVDNFIADMKTAGLWVKFSSIHAFFTGSAAGVVDLKGGVGRFAIGTAVYTARKGWNGGTGAGAGLTYTPAPTLLPEISQDSIMSITYFNNTDLTTIIAGSGSLFMTTTGGTNPLTGFLKLSSVNGLSGRANGPSNVSPAVSVPYDITTKSFLMIRRADSAGFVIQQHANDGTKVADAAITQASVAVASNGFRICSTAYASMPERFAFQTFGGALTDPEYDLFRPLMITFLTAFGALKV